MYTKAVRADVLQDCNADSKTMYSKYKYCSTAAGWYIKAICIKWLLMMKSMFATDLSDLEGAFLQYAS